ncbi:MAG: glycosyltransferase family protein [Nanoarchaeota archaeon]
MARIWYTVCGEGLGHATRSEAVIKELLKKHEVIITAYAKAYDYLKERYPKETHHIAGNTYVYKNNELLVVPSLMQLLGKLPKYIYKNFKEVLPLMKDFQPDIIITDFEATGAYYGLIMGIPVINLDNIHTLKECDIKYCVPWYIKAGMKILQPKGTRNIIPAFDDMHAKNNRTTVIAPIMKEEVRKLTPSDKGHVVVYQTSATNEQIPPVLANHKREFKIYGMGKRKSKGNLTFMPVNNRQFYKDLESASYVIVNGGFTLITEALYLKKPVLAIPVKNQIEQEYNGSALQRLGYGSTTKELCLKDIEAFEKNLPKYRAKIAKIPRWKTEIAVIEKAISACLER